MEDDPLFRRTRQHAEKRLVFSGAKSDKQRLVDIKGISSFRERNAT